MMLSLPLSDLFLERSIIYDGWESKLVWSGSNFRWTDRNLDRFNVEVWNCSEKFGRENELLMYSFHKGYKEDGFVWKMELPLGWKEGIQLGEILVACEVEAKSKMAWCIFWHLRYNWLWEFFIWVCKPRETGFVMKVMPQKERVCVNNIGFVFSSIAPKTSNTQTSTRLSQLSF